MIQFIIHFPLYTLCITKKKERKKAFESREKKNLFDWPAFFFVIPVLFSHFRNAITHTHTHTSHNSTLKIHFDDFFSLSPFLVVVVGVSGIIFSKLHINNRV